MRDKSAEFWRGLVTESMISNIRQARRPPAPQAAAFAKATACREMPVLLSKAAALCSHRATAKLARGTARMESFGGSIQSLLQHRVAF
jgi:hypothetical protein